MKYGYTLRATADTIRSHAQWIAGAVFGWSVWRGYTTAAVAAVSAYVATLVVAWVLDALGGRK